MLRPSISRIKTLTLLKYSLSLLVLIRIVVDSDNASRYFSQYSTESFHQGVVGSKRPRPFRKWAYVYLIGGCQHQNPNYRGFLYNVMASKYRLQQLGSQADVVVMIQMSVHTNDTKLPDYEVKLLDTLNIKLRYLPRYAAPVHENFYTLMLEKFRILELTEYSRAIYLDGDVLPLCNLDYLFELSEPESGDAIIKESALVGFRKEPSNGGFFMYRPDIDDYEWLQRIIRTKEEKALQLPYPHWDEVEGWGHKIEPPDCWRSPQGRNSTLWSWHGSFADQGLLYHWSKYVKQRVSLIIGDEIENWSSRNGSAYLEETIRNDLLAVYSCSFRQDEWRSPISDFIHFVGGRKPWDRDNYFRYQKYLKTISAPSNSTAGVKEDIVLFWYGILSELTAKHGMKFDFSHLRGDGNKDPPVGRFPKFQQMFDHIQAKASRNWNAYAEEDSPKGSYL